MPAAKAKPPLPAEVTSNPDIMGGMPCIRGTRVPAMTIVAEIRGGTSREEMFRHYPSMPLDGIEAVREWATERGIPLEPAPTEPCSSFLSTNASRPTSPTWRGLAGSRRTT